MCKSYRNDVYREFENRTIKSKHINAKPYKRSKFKIKHFEIDYV